jgi:hypothetical protein
MWVCPNCERIFEKKNQPHSCNKIPLSKHFENKNEAKKLFDYLVKQINKQIGVCKIISIPCCIHLFGTYDFLAALPKKDCLEIRFALEREIKSTKLKECVPVSAETFKNCLNIYSVEDVDDELVGYLKESYFLKEEAP